MADDTTAADQGGQSEGGQSADARLDALESRQDGMDGKLDRILELLPGRSPKDDAAADSSTAADTSTDIQSQVRAEIAATKAREAEEARAKGDSDWRKSVEDRIEALKPEKTPREAQTGWRGKLQSAMFGRPD